MTFSNKDNDLENRPPTNEEEEEEAERPLEASLARRIRTARSREWDGIVREGDETSYTEDPDVRPEKFSQVSIGREISEKIRSVVDPVRVLMFGSSVRTDGLEHPAAKSYSDIDLLVVVENSIRKRDAARKIYAALRDLNTPKDVVVVNRHDLSDPSPLIVSAMEEGIEIYSDSDS